MVMAFRLLYVADHRDCYRLAILSLLIASRVWVLFVVHCVHFLQSEFALVLLEDGIIVACSAMLVYVVGNGNSAEALSVRCK